MTTCHALTKSGKKCRNRVAKGNLCYLHRKNRFSIPRKSRKSKRRSFKKKSTKRSRKSIRKRSKPLKQRKSRKSIRKRSKPLRKRKSRKPLRKRSKPLRKRSKPLKQRKSRKPLKQDKCKKYFNEKVRENIDEYKSGKWVSRKQALAVSYSQTRKKKGCSNFGS